MKKLLIVGVCLVALTSLNACQAHNPRAGGGLLGGIAGGLLGNTIGKGSGKTAATVGGAILGTIVGSELASPSHGHNHGNNSHQGNNVVVGKCDHIANSGARSACERGVAERDRAAQRREEDRAYRCGRYGNCNPISYRAPYPYYKSNSRINHSPYWKLKTRDRWAYRCARTGRWCY